MPTLYNQTKNALSFEMGGKKYGCEAWGSVELPEKYLPFVTSYGLPLGPVPVVPEMRARVIVEEELDASRKSDLRKQREEALTAQAQARAAGEELGRAQIELGQARQRCAALEDEIRRRDDQIASLVAEKKAADELLQETARQATAAEERALKSVGDRTSAQKATAQELATTLDRLAAEEARVTELQSQIAALREQVNSAKADKKAAEELLQETARKLAQAEERMQKSVGDRDGANTALAADLAEARKALKTESDKNATLNQQIAALKKQVEAANADKRAAEDLLTDTAKRADELEERALRAEALNTVKTQDKSAKQKPAERS